MSQRVFISYSRRDGNAHAEKLQHDLEKAGFDTWRDTRNINPAQDFTAEIEVGIENSDIVALCLTADTKRPDSFVRREIQYAFAVEKPVIPCRVEKIAPHISVINFEWLEFYQDWDTAFERLRDIARDPNLSEETGDYEKAPIDPFHDYLQDLYKSIVRYLDQSVIRLIDLHSENTPDAVPTKRKDDILLEFFDARGLDSESQAVKQYKTFTQAFEEHNGRVLLLGNPGAGKTITLMSYARDTVAQRLNDISKPLPILKSIATWTSEPPQPIGDWIVDTNTELWSEINVGNALLLLDGLDELGGEREIHHKSKDMKTGKALVSIERYDPRKRFIRALKKVPSINQMLVTCRVIDYVAIKEQITLEGAVTLHPLTDDQLHEYLVDHPKIYDAILADNNLRDLSRTPLLLSLITFAFERLSNDLQAQGNLSAGDVRDVIFEAYCRERYEHENRRKSSDLPFTYREMMDILGELAMWNMQYSRPLKMYHDKEYKVEANVLIPYDFQYVLKDEKRIQAFQDMTVSLNILAPSRERNYRFAHLLLRDFLAYDFSIFCNHPSIDARLGAVNTLLNLADNRAVKPLSIALKDKNRFVRQNAIRSLEKLGEVTLLISALYDNHPDVKRSAILALGRLGDERALPHLILKLSDKEKISKSDDNRICDYAYEALHQIGTPEALQTCEDWLKAGNEYRPPKY